MTLWIDEPMWPAHGRLFAHLVSDTSYAELHDFALGQRMHPRSFDGDHYDVPQERWQQLVDAGAALTTGVDLARRLNASGLRLRKRKGDRGVSRQLAVPFPNGTSDVDLVAGRAPARDDQVFAAMVFVRDTRGRFAVVYSIRRDEWGSPGGWREPGESPAENAVRETLEETGLVIDAQRVIPCGYERFTPHTDDNVIEPGRPYLQVFRTELDVEGGPLTEGDDGIRETRWADPAEFARLCSHLFWWPLAVEIYPELALELRVGQVDQGDGRDLVQAHIAEMHELYDGLELNAEGMPQAGPGELGPPGGTLRVGYLDGRPVCAGGVKRLSADACEIKRMYVVPWARRRGIGRALLRALEDAARSLDYRVARLDTGHRQPGAQALYESEGYLPIGNFNGHPTATFFGEKALC